LLDKNIIEKERKKKVKYDKNIIRPKINTGRFSF
jgi:hypothetical protein